MANAQQAKETEKSRTLVINNKEALVIAQMPHLGMDTSGVPQLGAAITFLPGVNLVHRETLRTLRQNPAFDLQFTTEIQRSAAPEQNPEKVGKYVLVQGPDVPEKASLSSLSDDAAEKIVKETFIPSLLNHFKDGEARDNIRAAISNQIEMIKTGNVPVGAGTF